MGKIYVEQDTRMWTRGAVGGRRDMRRDEGRVMVG